MAFGNWFNKKGEPQKEDSSQSQQASASPKSTPSNKPEPAADPKPLLKPLVKSGPVPTLKALPTTTPAATTPPDPVGLKLRPKVDQRALYQQLINGLYDAVLILDDRGNVMESNIRVDEVLGYTRDEAWDLPITTIIPGMTRQLFEHLKKNLAENHHVLIDSRCFRKDGSSFSGEVGVCNITFMRGNNMIFTIRNVERRKNSMIDVKKLQAAIDHSLSPMFICDPDGTFTVANQLALDLFGVQTLMDAKTAKLETFLPNAGTMFQEALKGNKACNTLTLNRQEKAITFTLSLEPIRNGDDLIGVTGSILFS